jgi:hypothetical protein
MTLTAVWQFAMDHEAVISLFGLAFVVTMPEEPPASVGEIPRWLYNWVHDGLKAFVSFRSPVSTQKSTYVQESPGTSTTKITESKTIAGPPSEGGK